MKAGDTLGPYRILDKLGEGGMGEVYRATDTTLGRQVAIKVLPEAVASDADRLARFEREARTLAAVNHPNIAAIYGVEGGSADEASGSGRAVRALVMELVEGPTLAERLAQGARLKAEGSTTESSAEGSGLSPGSGLLAQGSRAGSGLPVDEALAIAKQIAQALEAAHEQGIVHRDLKPANIKVRPDGTVKVLDFGLAKAMEPAGATVGSSMAPTITTPAMTQAGMILGTAAYMSPEQARGKGADKRSDIWAFGCVLYEMLTGQRAFPGEDVTDTVAAVVKLEPKWDAFPADVPPRVRQVLRVCLQKDPRRRGGDIAAIRLALEGAFETPAPRVAEAQAAPVGRGRLLTVAAAAALVAVLAVGLLAWNLWSSPEPRAVTRWDFEVPADKPFRNPTRDVIAVAPDGRSFVYNTLDGFYVRPMGDLEPRLIPGTAGENVGAPFFSPDSQWIGYWDPGTDQVKRVAVSGGTSLVVADHVANFLDANWEADGTILFGSRLGVSRVPATGGTPQVVIPVEPGEAAGAPHLLPDGDSVLFTLASSANWADGQMVVASLSTGKRTVVFRGGSHARYVPTGHLVYAIRGALFAVAFDATTLAVRGGSVPLAQDVLWTGGTGISNFSVSDDGTLVYVSGSASAAARTLVWVDREGHETPINTPPRAYLYPRISPDGTRVALDVRDQQNDIWVWSLARQTLTRLTFEPDFDRVPVWSRDGKRIAYMTGPNGNGKLLWRAADGTGTTETLAEGDGSRFPTSFDPKDRGIVLLEMDRGDSGQDVSLLSLEGQHNVTPLVHASFDELNGEVSPNGRWLAYQSNESGQMEVFVRSFPDAESGGRWQVSPGGGTRPVWRADGRELFYLIPPGRVMAVQVDAGETFSYGNARELFNGPYIAANFLRTYDVTADGRRFLMIKSAAATGDAAPPRVVVVENWLEELKRLAPVR